MPHLFTDSLDHPECKFGAAVGEEGRERERHINWTGLSVVFVLFSWHCIGYLY
jgi:hypothetical protein